MKLKTDFVTNSSSTAYIVFIPNNFSVTEAYVQRIYDERVSRWIADEENDISELTGIVEGMIEDIKSGESIGYYDGMEYRMAEWNTLVEICEENRFVITDVEIPSEGSNTIQGVTEEVILRILINHIDLDKFIKPFIEGGPDVTKIAKEV